MSQVHRQKGYGADGVRYHLVWAVRRRREVLVGDVASRAEELIRASGEENGCEVLEMEVEPEHVRVLVRAPTDLAPRQIAHRMKSRSAGVLRREYPELRKLPSLWTRALLVSTADRLKAEEIRSYVGRQARV